MTTTPPVPVPDAVSEGYWTAAADGRLVIARCSRCDQLTHPPDVVCPRCSHPAPAFEFEEVSGRGQVCSWTVVHQASLPGMTVPYVLVDVRLAEDSDVRLIGRLVDGPGAPVELAALVEVVFDDVGGQAVPAFRLVGR